MKRTQSNPLDFLIAVMKHLFHMQGTVADIAENTRITNDIHSQDNLKRDRGTVS